MNSAPNNLNLNRQQFKEASYTPKVTHEETAFFESAPKSPNVPKRVSLELYLPTGRVIIFYEPQICILGCPLRWNI